MQRTESLGCLLFMLMPIVIFVGVVFIVPDRSPPRRPPLYIGIVEKVEPIHNSGRSVLVTFKDKMTYVVWKYDEGIRIGRKHKIYLCSHGSRVDRLSNFLDLYNYAKFLFATPSK